MLFDTLVFGQLMFLTIFLIEQNTQLLSATMLSAKCCQNKIQSKI